MFFSQYSVFLYLLRGLQQVKAQKAWPTSPLTKIKNQEIKKAAARNTQIKNHWRAARLKIGGR